MAAEMGPKPEPINLLEKWSAIRVAERAKLRAQGLNDLEIDDLIRDLNPAAAGEDADPIELHGDTSSYEDPDWSTALDGLSDEKQ